MSVMKSLFLSSKYNNLRKHSADVISVESIQIQERPQVINVMTPKHRKERLVKASQQSFCLE